MSTTTIIWVFLYVSGAILSFIIHPIYGLMGYFLDYYAHPPLRWWGNELPDLRWALMISFMTVVAVFIKRNRLPPLKNKVHPQTKWLILFICNTFLVTPMAVWPDKNWEALTDLLKYGALFFLIIYTVRTKQHFRWVLLFHLIGVFYWGWTAYDHPKRVGGRLVGMGGSDSLNDNAMASHLLAIMPFLGAFFMVGSRWEKLLSILAAPFILNAFILCNSRGAFLSLLLVACASIYFMKGATRWKAAASLAAAGVLFLYLADPQFIDRQMTVLEFKEDSSATGRLRSWQGAMELILDHPLGTGGGGFNALSKVYIPEIVEAHGGEARSVHSTYFMAATEWGIQGFFFFLVYIGMSFRELFSIHRAARRKPVSREFEIMSVMLKLSLLGLASTAAFNNRLYAEPFYWLPALIAVLRNIQLKELKDTQEADVSKADE